MLTPNIFVVMGICGKLGLNFYRVSFKTGVNLVLIMVTGYFCLISIFGLCLAVKIEKGKHSEKFKQRYQFILDNILYFIMPFGSTIMPCFIFTPLITIFNIFRLVYLIKIRKLYPCG